MPSVEEIKQAIAINKQRLSQEIQESKLLFSLLKQSTHRPLTREEKKQVQDQLLDICKSIPALAVFLLPGGAILLPILMKCMPNILPSAFREEK